MNIVIPMAGKGSRFVEGGYKKPKPFIDMNGETMIERVLDNLEYPNAKYILLARTEHMIQESELIKTIEAKYNAKFIAVDKLTEGTVCTVLYARKYINNSEPLLIANSDQIVDANIGDYIDESIDKELDGSILTFLDETKNPHWSYAKLNAKGLVSEVKEKQPISNIATVGIYFFNEGRLFVDSAIDMIINNDRVNNEFYTCPVYNYAISSGARIGVHNINMNSMHCLGTPEDLQEYLKEI